MKLKLIVSILLVVLASSKIIAQDNIFLSRDYWKGNPSIAQIKEAILKDNSPSELNKHGFDAVVYALLEQVNDETFFGLPTKEILT